VEALEIPHGTLLGEIDPSAAAHLHRQNLFHKLGARPYSRALICDAIVQEQQAADFQPESIQACDYVARAVFLFESGWENNDGCDLWVATEAGVPRHGSETYTNSIRQRCAKQVLHGRLTPFNFLHEGYSNASSAMSGDWTRWLFKNLYIAEIPRLVTGLSPKLILAMDFRVLRKEDPVQLLLVLRDHWTYYATIFLSEGSPDCENEEAKKDLRATVAAVEVACIGGHVQSLCQTTLPRADVISGALEAASFLDVPDPDDPRWKFLSHFGVVVDPGFDQFVKYLRQAKATPGSFKRISGLYKQINAFAADHLEEIK
jgi:hypothetical protein